MVPSWCLHGAFHGAFMVPPWALDLPVPPLGLPGVLLGPFLGLVWALPGPLLGPPWATLVPSLGPVGSHWALPVPSWAFWLVSLGLSGPSLGPFCGLVWAFPGLLLGPPWGHSCALMGFSGPSLPSTVPSPASWVTSLGLSGPLWASPVHSPGAPAPHWANPVGHTRPRRAQPNEGPMKAQ